MMSKVILLLIATFLVAGIVAQIPGAPKPGQTQINAFSANGFDAILLDTPSWVTSIQKSWGGTDEFFVFGRETMRAIHSGRNSTSDFYAEIIPANSYSLKFSDLHTFYYTDNAKVNWMTTFGVSPYDVNQAKLYENATGSYIPLVAIRQQIGSTTPPATFIQPINATDGTLNLDGFMLSALRSDEYSMRANGQAVVYFAGFRTTTNQSDPIGTAFVLLRTYFLMEPAAGSWGPFTFDPVDDLFVIYNNSFNPYSATNKPWVHLVISQQNGQNVTFVVIVDPSTKGIYGVNVNNPTQQSSYTLDYPEARYEFVSCAYDPFRQMLVIGVSAEGFEHGRLWLFDFSLNPLAVLEPTIVQLPANYSNPKALAIDFDPYNITNGHIYVGFNGWNEVLRYNYATQQVDGYQRLPEYLLRSWDATVTPHHVYFVSNEQNSKVYRVSKSDFCPATCPFFGFCKEGKCGCAEGFELSKDHTQCVLTVAKQETIYVHKYKTAHGGEIALGLLFMFSFLAAAGGWFLWYRGRRGAYQAV